MGKMKSFILQARLKYLKKKNEKLREKIKKEMGVSQKIKMDPIYPFSKVWICKKYNDTLNTYLRETKY